MAIRVLSMKHFFLGEFCSVALLVLCSGVQRELLVSSQAALGKVFPGGGCQEDHAPLLSTGEPTPGVPGPVLHSPVQERHGHTGDSPEQGHGQNDRAVAPLL